MPGAVAYTCNPGALETESRNSVGSIAVGLTVFFGRWVDCVATCNPALGEEPG